MSDTTATHLNSTSTLEDDIGTARPEAQGGPSGGGRILRLALFAVLLVLLLIAPLFLEGFWLRVGFGVFGAAIGAIGLNLLVGSAGQLSLAHAFFLAVGAVTYTYLSGEPGGTASPVDGLGWPPIVGMIAGVLLAGLFGLIFSPIAARLRGIYLGVASLGLVFIGLHIMNTWTPVTGGFNGRAVPSFSLFGFSFGGNESPPLYVLNVPFGAAERQWYLGLVLAALAYLFAVNLLRSRPGRALQTLRDSETAASVMGVNVQAYKAKIFLASSMYAGLSGVIFALSIGSIAPESFTLEVSVLYLAMIVLGGLGSVNGAVLGAIFVAALPVVFQRYANVLPLLAEPGQGGVTAAQGARILFGLAIILVVLFEPAGIAGLGRKLVRLGTPSRTARGATSQPTPSNPPAQGSNT